MAPGACSTGRTWWVAMPRTAHAMGAPNRLSGGEKTPPPPRDSLSPPPHRRKEVQIPGPDRSRANRTGHLHVLTIAAHFNACQVRTQMISLGHSTGELQIELRA